MCGSPLPPPSATHHHWLAQVAVLAGRRAVALKALHNGGRQRPAMWVGRGGWAVLQLLLQLLLKGSKCGMEPGHAGQ